MSAIISKKSLLYRLAYEGYPPYVQIPATFTRADLIAQATSRLVTWIFAGVANLLIFFMGFVAFCFLVAVVLSSTSVDPLTGAVVVPELVVYVAPIGYTIAVVGYLFLKYLWTRRNRLVQYTAV